jgi:hypothetical protein
VQVELASSAVVHMSTGAESSAIVVMVQKVASEKMTRMDACIEVTINIAVLILV